MTARDAGWEQRCERCGALDGTPCNRDPGDYPCTRGTSSSVLTREEILSMRSYGEDGEGPLTPTGLATWKAICDAAIQSLSSAIGGIAEGFNVFVVTPTEEMCDRGWTAYWQAQQRGDNIHERMEAVYYAMHANSPIESARSGAGAAFENEDFERGYKAAMLAKRDEVIEECAKVADDAWASSNSLLGSKLGGHIARTIRALKNRNNNAAPQAHNGHPAEDWDRACPGCQAEDAARNDKPHAALMAYWPRIRNALFMGRPEDNALLIEIDEVLRRAMSARTPRK